VLGAKVGSRPLILDGYTILMTPRRVADKQARRLHKKYRLRPVFKDFTLGRQSSSKRRNTFCVHPDLPVKIGWTEGRGLRQSQSGASSVGVFAGVRAQGRTLLGRVVQTRNRGPTSCTCPTAARPADACCLAGWRDFRSPPTHQHGLSCRTSNPVAVAAIAVTMVARSREHCPTCRPRQEEEAGYPKLVARHSGFGRGSRRPEPPRNCRRPSLKWPLFREKSE